MKEVWGVTMVRDEADIIEHTLTHMISEGVDGIVVADNLSTDATPDILRAVQRNSNVPVLIVEDKVVAYRQSLKMTALVELAAAHGAEYIIPFDADEFWTCVGRLRLADCIRDLGLDVIRVPYYDHYCTALDPVESNPFKRMKWRESKFSSWNGIRNRRIAFRCYRHGCVLAQGNHYLILENGRQLDGDESYLYMHHFPYRSVEQFVVKVKNGIEAYEAATELPASYGHVWREHGAILRAEGIEGVRRLFYSKWFVTDPRSLGLVLNQTLPL
jgi:glycosyltransferase involved in cell wall biosynthesis